MSIRLAFATLVVFGGAFAQKAPPRYISVPPADSPALSARGKYSVGVRTIEFTHPKQTDILHFDKATGQAPVYDRPLTIDVWYPALIPAGQREETVYRMPIPGGLAVDGQTTVDIPDKALRDAPPVTGASFPLVIVSHGYPGSRYFMTYLTANLASKGYVVAAIDHTDSLFNSMKGFESTLINRPADQLFTIESLQQLERQPGHFLHGVMDGSNAAIVGYSMGGYGALISAGAGVSSASPLLQFVPGGYLKVRGSESAEFRAVDRRSLKAIVAIAPWGEHPPHKVWDAAGLADVHIPSLFIAGDHDDVADFAQGIKPAFEGVVNSDRCLLVYENAMHNTGANPPPDNLLLPYPVLQAFEEPAWRKERITAINQHFITAFLDLHLKGDAGKASYLHLDPERSNDGKWAAPPLTPDSGEFSSGKDKEGNAFWKGFQRREALGMEMVCHPSRQGGS